MTPHYADEHLTVWLGEVREALEAMEPESVDCVVTSPPYFSLRDYGLPPATWGGDPDHEHAWGEAIVATNEGWTGKDRWNHRVNGDGLEYEIVDDRRRPDQGAFCACGAWCGQLGLEPDPFLYLDHLVEVFAAVRRVLRRDGTVWLNLGDSYAAKTRGSDAGWDKSRLTNPGYSQKASAASMRRTGERHRGKGAGFKNKDRMMMPARAAIALQGDGWWLRDEIVWSKSNPMPSSVEDRTTPAHEMVYLLTRSARYRYDADAIREVATHAAEAKYDPGTNGHSADRSSRGSGKSTRRFGSKPAAKRPAGWNAGPTVDDLRGRYGTAQELKLRQNGHLHANLEAAKDVLGRNKRSVWTVATEPYPEAHFATFPERLIEPMILAGCPIGGVVLDPFGGSGTVGVVAQRLGRRAVLVDLSAEYVEQMIRRIAAARGAGEGPAVDMPVPFASDGLWAAES